MGDESGYDLDDPKHPTWADRMVDKADDLRKAAKEAGKRGASFEEVRALRRALESVEMELESILAVEDGQNALVLRLHRDMTTIMIEFVDDWLREKQAN